MAISRIAVVSDSHGNLLALQAVWTEFVGRDGLSSAGGRRTVRHHQATTLARGR
jgi:hypothetical protein